MQRIAIHSVPRSGSTWLGELFNSNPHVIYKYQPLFSYSFKNRLTPISSRKEIIDFYEELIATNDDFTDQIEARENGKMPAFKKSIKPKAIAYKEVRHHHILENLLQQDNEIKVIGLIRNPFAVIYSWLNASKEFRKDLGWDELEEWRYAHKKNLNKIEEFNGFDKWKDVTAMFLKLEKKFPHQFKIVYYNDLLNETENTIKELFQFCNLLLTETTKKFIIESQLKENTDAYSVYKIKKDDHNWKDKLNPTIIKEIEKELINTEFEKYYT